jgi:glutaredoxin-like protein DUF836
MATPTIPDLILYGRPDCGLCAEARSMIELLLADRAERGLPTPTFVERDIDSDPDWQRAFFAIIPVVDLGDRRLETVTSMARLRRLLADEFGVVA